jgi:hypothetical protein
LVKKRPGLAGSKRILFLVARSAVYEMPPLFRLSPDQPLIQAFLPEWPPFFNLNTEPHETHLFSGAGHLYPYYQHHLPVRRAAP